MRGARSRGTNRQRHHERGIRNVLMARVALGTERLREPWHPVQKPNTILARLVVVASWPGGLVLDPFMGHACRLDYTLPRVVVCPGDATRLPPLASRVPPDVPG